MITRTLANTVVMLALAGLGTGCGDDDNPMPPGTDSFEVSLSQLPSLDAGKGHYEAWIGFPEPDGKALHGELELISLGKFQVGTDGQPVDLDGAPPNWELALERNPSFAAEGWISIEPEGDLDTIPSGPMLAGLFEGTVSRGVSSLNGAYRSIWDLPTADLDFSAIEGVFTLETPSDTDDGNEGQGLYWREGDDAGLATLPALDGVRLQYEGWVEETATGALFSTGRFTDPADLDSDGAGFGAGGDETPFPGQEYLGAAAKTLNQGGYRTFVTLEPTDDNDAAAPTWFVLVDATIAPATPTGTPNAMENRTSSLPTATIVINR